MKYSTSHFVKLIVASTLCAIAPSASADHECGSFDLPLSDTQQRDRSGSLGAQREEARGDGLTLKPCKTDTPDYAQEMRKLKPKTSEIKPAADPQWGILRPNLTAPVNIDITLSPDPQDSIVPDSIAKRIPAPEDLSEPLAR